MLNLSCNFIHGAWARTRYRQLCDCFNVNVFWCFLNETKVPVFSFIHLFNFLCRFIYLSFCKKKLCVEHSLALWPYYVVLDWNLLWCLRRNLTQEYDNDAESIVSSLQWSIEDEDIDSGNPSLQFKYLASVLAFETWNP